MNISPKDIVNIVLIIAVIGILVYLFSPSHRTVKRTIKAQQELIEDMRSGLNTVLKNDSLRDIKDNEFLTSLDSAISKLSKEDSAQMVQIKLLWRNNYAIRKEFDSAFSAVPVLPDF